MTEADWLACTDPEEMLEFLRGKVSDRKLRLLACACCRRVWHLLADERSRYAVEVAERFADGSVDETEVYSSTLGLKFPSDALEDAAFLTAVPQCYRPSQLHRYGIIDLARLDEKALKRIGDIYHSGLRFPPDAALVVARRTAVDGPAEAPTQAALLRCLVGPLPFRPVAINSSWLTWNDRTVPKIAQAIYDERAFDRMPILADALEEGGCANEDILGHCRQPGEHVRGCWVVDLLLGKE